jgi:RNA-directed DNA polymerase
MVKGTRAQAQAIMAELPEIVGRMGLRLSAAKTHLTHIDDGFTFLGSRCGANPGRASSRASTPSSLTRRSPPSSRR